jgi:hypothetical protein
VIPVTIDELFQLYREIWAVDFEFQNTPGDRPDPVCLTARELKSGRRVQLWRNQFGPEPPYPTDEHTLLVAFFASAEIGCHLALGWPVSKRVLDLYTEHRNETNGLKTLAGSGLRGALVSHGLDAIAAADKYEMRSLVLRGGPWTFNEIQEILQYNDSDVISLVNLLQKQLAKIDFPRALFRGRCMTGVARIEHNGVPIDVATHTLMDRHWTYIQDDLIARLDRYGIFDGRSFRSERWARLLEAQGIPWPRLDTGRLDLEDDTFRQMARLYPEIVSPYRELRRSLADLRLSDLAIGKDGRNRTLLSPFRARTSRSQPSNSKFIFGPSVWIRGLIQAPEGYAIAYIDYEQQEFGIAASLSGDGNMQRAYMSGDPYLAFAKQAGAISQSATRTPEIEGVREQYKTTALGVLYGMEPHSLGQRIERSPGEARDLLRAHHEAYRRFWDWSDAMVDYAMLYNHIYTVFGWVIHVDDNVNSRSLRNFPMQANGAEMLRLAFCLATEAGIEVCAPVHDALLICSPIDRVEEDVARTEGFMREASRIVLAGFELRTEAKIVKFPDRYMDKRGRKMWDEVLRLVTEAEHNETLRRGTEPHVA